MARTVVGPPRNNAYVAMLGLAVFGMVVSCALLGLELSGYDPATPPAVQTVSLPKAEPRPAAPTGGTPAGGAPANPGGGMAKVDPPAVPAPTPPPAPVAIAPLPPAPAPAPAVAKTEPPKVELPKAGDAKPGPRPGFNLFAPVQIPPSPPQP